VRDLADKGPTDAELSRAKAVLRGGVWMSDESPASRAGRNAAQTLMFGRPVASDDTVARLQAVSSNDLKAVGTRVLTSGLASTAVLGPRAAAGAGRAFVERVAG